ncbi:hypothetical protein CC80DRAFT_508393 [Byssothecium circinans]|uniref:Uncharacterized protein n=1 Tax=Byssothecium circinans TaxID=147558 RepID=A0A6A5TSX2_9PLEO|nr:hypothetical protein CC80DRAFT_508393 [Byssothecium circinans]
MSDKFDNSNAFSWPLRSPGGADSAASTRALLSRNSTVRFPEYPSSDDGVSASEDDVDAMDTSFNSAGTAAHHHPEQNEEPQNEEPHTPTRSSQELSRQNEEPKTPARCNKRASHQTPKPRALSIQDQVYQTPRQHQREDSCSPKSSVFNMKEFFENPTPSRVPAADTSDSVLHSGTKVVGAAEESPTKVFNANAARIDVIKVPDRKAGKTSYEAGVYVTSLTEQEEDAKKGQKAPRKKTVIAYLKDLVARVRKEKLGGI